MATRLLALTTLLHGLVASDSGDGAGIEHFLFTHLVEECDQYATPEVITFYITSLWDTVGLGWLAPSL